MQKNVYRITVKRITRKLHTFITFFGVQNTPRACEECILVVGLLFDATPY